MSCHAAEQLDLLGYGRTCVHRLDSRSKLLAAMSFVVCVASFPKYEVSALVPLAVVPVSIGVLGGVPLRLVLRLLIAASPFALMLGMFNPLLDRTVWLKIGSVVISAGWLSFASILIRFMLSVGMVLVLIATTSVPGLLSGLRRFGLPRPFVDQVQFLYRYLFLLLEEGEHISHARQVREPLRRNPDLRTAKAMLYSLLWRTWERANSVFLCLKCRGFETDLPVFQRSSAGWRDLMFLMLSIGTCLAVRFLPLTESLGEFLLRR